MADAEADAPDPEAPFRSRLLAHVTEGGVAVEIGVHLGAFAARILEEARPAVLHLVDPWRVFRERAYDRTLFGRYVPQAELDARHDAVRDRFAAEIAEGRVVLHRMTSGEAAPAFAARSLDFVYIDGDHSYAGVAADLSAYWPKLRRRGILACDDYTRGGWWGDGVVHAMRAVLRRRDAMVAYKDGSQIAVRRVAPTDEGALA